uniref:PRKC apoptosis WT1 regulator protein n=1 Tax=Geotrypetes seraphini TaxID=260995 RepID=A0A6P8RPU4_GEOSA|nr:PRKC apoptosis WT1 regulator protein [Geotrypetes seraphini]XP_033807565.1 PRKC apoptosis WT1 regulator protein [Geotrypetes seraphini]XP_033807566.1 PRKC apoptosis WT1 regulator protein [Geotrypetes seraphini]XP_033807567.1 PRKC apoptosis WT1 regulator protein [Geotrypetes seraphini]
MASGGGYRASSGTTDFLEEWKAKREKMRAKAQSEGGPAPTITAEGSWKPGPELNNNSAPPVGPTSLLKAVSRRLPTDEEPVPGATASRKGPEKVGTAVAVVAGAPQQQLLPPPPQEGLGVCTSDDKDSPPAKAKDKGKSSGPSARKGKGQIEKRKLREKRRSTGVVNIPSTESPDEYDDDESGQKERKREDAVTQSNTIQNESFSVDPNDSYVQQDSAKTVSSRFKGATNAPEEDISNRYSRTERTGYNRYNREANSSTNSVQSSGLEKKIEELERELAKERQENTRLLKMVQDKDEIIGKMKEEIDLLNRDLDDIEDENEQLKQENKTLLKVVGQLTR